MPINSCADILAAECFSNYDCQDNGTRCENRGTEAKPVPCCSPGPRGAGIVGAACTGENDCKSSLCVDSDSGKACTDTCTTPADCPMAQFKNCDVIAFSGSSQKFCLP